MKKTKRISWSILLLALPVLFMASGCEKFLDRKPLTATLDDINQGGIEGQVFGLYSAIKDYDIGNVFGGIPWQGVHNFRSDDSEKGSDAASAIPAANPPLAACDQKNPAIFSTPFPSASDPRLSKIGPYPVVGKAICSAEQTAAISSLWSNAIHVM